MNILIGGDSWTLGEFPPPTGLIVNHDIVPVHSGIQQYFEDSGHQVVNVGIGGASNATTIDMVKKSLWPGIDQLIFFYTDPLRQITQHELETQLPFDLIQNYSTGIKHQFEEIKNQYPNLKITIVGGCSYCPEQTSCDWLIPSFTTLLYPTFIDTPYMLSFPWNVMLSKTDQSILLPEQKSQYSHIIEEATRKLDFWKSSREFFWPEQQHPNRLGHKKLYEHIINLW